MHPKKRQRVSPESRHDGEKDKRPVTSLFGSTMMVGGLSRAFRLFKVPILIYAALRRECHRSIFGSNNSLFIKQIPKFHAN